MNLAADPSDDSRIADDRIEACRRDLLAFAADNAALLNGLPVDTVARIWRAAWYDGCEYGVFEEANR